MADPIKNQFRKCIVRLSISDEIVGGGFFVAPGWIATSKHVIQPAIDACGSIDILSGETPDRFERHIVHSSLMLAHPDYDLALIKWEYDPNPFVHLNDECAIGDTLYTSAYFAEREKEETLTLTCTGTRTDPEMIKAGDDSVQPGMSGSPVLNLRTCSVCGLIDSTRGPYTQLGCWALSSRLLTAFLNNVDTSSVSHLCPNWVSTALETIRQNAGGIGELDATSAQNHFYPFEIKPHPVDQLFVEPCFTFGMINIESEPPTLTRCEPATFVKTVSVTLETHQLLLLLGPYGSGKTFLLKVLQLEGRHLFQDIVFVECRNLGKLQEWPQFIDQVKARAQGRSLTLMFDGFEDLLEATPFDGSVALRVLHNIARLSCHEDKGKRPYRVILSSREVPYLDNSEDGINRILTGAATATATYGGTFTVPYIQLLSFNKTVRNTWITTYATLQGRTCDDALSCIEQIDSSTKGISRACSIPLFLFCFATKWLKPEGQLFGTSNTLPTPFEIYNEFVDRTVEGHFQGRFPDPTGTRLGSLCSDYRLFLRKVSASIEAGFPELLATPMRLDWETDDNNTIGRRNYGLTVEELHSIIDDMSSGVLQQSVARVSPDAKFATVGALLSCYFFDEVDGRWSFRDNNILYFFLADALAEKLFRLVQRPSAPGAECSLDFRQVASMDAIPIHQMSIEMLIQRLNRDQISRINQKKGVTAPAWLRSGMHVTHEELLQAIKVMLRETDSVGVPLFGRGYSARIENRLLLLLIVVYQQLRGIDEGETPLVSRLHGHITYATEVRDIRAYNTWRTFHRRVRWTGLNLGPVKCDGFNFRDSQFKQVRFVQARFEQVQFDGSKCFPLEFELCRFEKSSFNGIEGFVSLKRCSIDELSVSCGSDRAEVHFRQCTIKALRLDFSASLTINISDSSIDTIIAIGRYGRLLIKRCEHNAIKNNGYELRIGFAENRPISKVFKRQVDYVEVAYEEPKSFKEWNR